MGIKFLKHIERCKTLLHLIDITEKDLIKSYKQVREELKKYSKDLLDKKELVVFNKIDLIEKDQIKKKLSIFKQEINKNVIVMSTLDKKTVSDIKSKLINYVS